MHSLSRIVLSVTLTSILFVSAPILAKEKPHHAAQTTVKKTVKADGSTIERAVVIIEDDTMRGIGAENRWIAENMPGYRTESSLFLFFFFFKQKTAYEIVW